MPPHAAMARGDFARRPDWHTAAVIVTVIAQMAAVVFYGGRLSEKIDAIGLALLANGGLEHRLSTMETELQLRRKPLP